MDGIFPLPSVFFVICTSNVIFSNYFAFLVKLVLISFNLDESPTMDLDVSDLIPLDPFLI